MTQKFNFELELKTTDDLSQEEVNDTLANFVDHITSNEKVLYGELSEVDGKSEGLTPDEIERLLNLVEQVDEDEKTASMKIAKDLCTDNDNQ